MKFSLLSLTVAAALLPSFASADLVINQTEIIVPLSPGGQATRVIQLSNSGKNPQSVSVFASDWQQSETGAVDAIDPGKQPRSATQWIGVNPPRFVLPPGKTQEISVNFAIPASSKLEEGDYTTMVFSQTEDVVTRKDPGSGREVNLRVIGRIGTKIFIRQPNVVLKPSAEINGMQLETENGKTAVKITLSNTGKSFFRSEKSFVQIQDAKGEVLSKEPVPAFSCLPDNTRILTLPLPLKSGKRYTLLAMVDYGAPEILAGELEVMAP